MQHLNNPMWRKGVSFFLAFLILVFSSGCNYYTVWNAVPKELPVLEKAERNPNYFVLHLGPEQFQLTGVEVDSSFLTGRIEPLTRLIYYSPDRKSRQYENYEHNILHEVHIILKGEPVQASIGERISIPLDSIEKIKVIEPDTLKELLAITGGIFIMLIVLMIIWAAIKSSCPYIYVNTGDSFTIQGEIYSGAIFKGMERSDYLPLPELRPVDNSYQVRIANELKEEQHTNLANLLVVNHPQGTQCWMDQAGTPYLAGNPVKPFEAFSGMGRDFLAQLSITDHNACLFNEEEPDTNRLYLGFQKPEFAAEGTLLLNVKNALWGEYVCGEFLKKFGYLYPTWVKVQNRKPPEKVKAGLDEMGFPLRVYLETKNGWELIHRMELTGALVDRNVAVPIDLSQVRDETLHLRLESTFMFWEVDYAAMDFSPIVDLEVHELKPCQAFGSTGTDAQRALSADDDLYLDHWETGDVTEVRFEVPPIPEGYSKSCFLHSKGYYNHVREYTHAPELAELKKFKTPGYLNAYSKELFKRIGEAQGERVTLN